MDGVQGDLEGVQWESGNAHNRRTEKELEGGSTVAGVPVPELIGKTERVEACWGQVFATELSRGVEIDCEDQAIGKATH